MYVLSPCVQPRPDDVADASDGGGARVRDSVHIRAVAQQNPAAGTPHQPVLTCSESRAATEPSTKFSYHGDVHWYAKSASTHGT